jgi:hypothetical protein
LAGSKPTCITRISKIALDNPVTQEDLEEAVNSIMEIVQLVRTTRQEVEELTSNVIAFHRETVAVYTQLTEFVKLGISKSTFIM